MSRRRHLRRAAVFVALLAAGCSTAPPPPPVEVVVNTSNEKDRVNAVVDGWHRAAADADEQAYFDAMTDDAVFLGTDASGRWDKLAFRAYAHPHFARGKAWRFTPTRRAVILSADGRLAWFDEDLDTPNLGPCRGSGVLRKEDGRWRIAHYNLTLTIPNDALAAVRQALANSAGGGAVARGIHGVVRLRGAAPAMPVPPQRKDHEFCLEQPRPLNAVRVHNGRLADVLVTVAGAKLNTTGDEELPPVQLHYRDCEIRPRILVAQSEQIVVIHNDDRTMHNVNARLGADLLFNFAQPRGAPTQSKSFEEPGLVRIRCDVHPWERSFIYVSDHGHVAVTDEQGAFHLPELPWGRYRLKAWHSQYGWQQRDVTLAQAGLEVNIEYRADMPPPEENPDELAGLTLNWFGAR